MMRCVLLALALGASGCASQPPQQCDVTDVDALFASRLEYQDKQFCGYGYWYGGEEFGGIYARRIADYDERYQRPVILLTGEPSDGIWRPEIRNNDRVFLSGRIDADDCVPRPDDDEHCAPFADAIFIEGWRLRRAR